jgi:hypothetical protein
LLYQTFNGIQTEIIKRLDGKIEKMKVKGKKHQIRGLAKEFGITIPNKCPIKRAPLNTNEICLKFIKKYKQIYH